MKKTSMLLAATIFLYGAPYVYADGTEIYPGMSDDEINAVLEENDISLDPDDTTESIDEEEDAAPSDDPAADTPSLNLLPPYVSVDLSNPVHTSGPCAAPPFPSHRVTGADMATIMGIFYVTVKTNIGTFNAPWVPWILPDSGIAIGPGWMLYQRGNTFNNPWWIITSGVTIKWIKIDLWHNGNNPKTAVFDIIKYREVTPGSSVGFPFTKLSLNWPLDTNVVYSLPVLGTPNDLFGIMTINFPSGFTGHLPFNFMLKFRADTDCMPVEAAKAKSYQDGRLTFTLTMSKEGSGHIAERCGVDPILVAGPFTVKDGEGTVEFSTDLTLQPGCYYSVVNVADDGSREAIPLEGVTTNESNEYYHAE